jgi:hypothetical protein
MNTPPDFYLYEIEDDRDLIRTLRACRKFAVVEHGGQQVTLATVDPPIAASGILPAGVSTAVIGLSPHGKKPFDRLAPGEIGSALIWEVYDLSGGKLAVAAAPGLGRGTIYKSRPAIDSKGRVMPPPAAARQVLGSIIRALESGDGKK